MQCCSTNFGDAVIGSNCALINTTAENIYFIFFTTSGGVPYVNNVLEV